jgi:hypothetical protein
MTERPQPKELVIRIVNEQQGILSITVGSPDARAWIDKEAPGFGSLYWHPQWAALLVAETYNIHEFVAWLNQYNR